MLEFSPSIDWAHNDAEKKPVKPTKRQNMVIQPKRTACLIDESRETENISHRMVAYFRCVSSESVQHESSDSLN